MKITTQVKLGTRPSMSIWIPGNQPHISVLQPAFVHFSSCQWASAGVDCRWGCTRAVYALILASRGQPYIVLLSKFNMRCALDVASIMSRGLPMQVRFLLSFKPRYLNDSTHSRLLLLMWYHQVGGVFCERYTCITLHLLLFNDSCHLFVCLRSLLRSSWRDRQSWYDATSLEIVQSSAKRPMWGEDRSFHVAEVRERMERLMSNGVEGGNVLGANEKVVMVMDWMCRDGAVARALERIWKKRFVSAYSPHRLDLCCLFIDDHVTWWI